MKQPNRVKAAMRAGRRAYGYNAADHHTAIGMGDENDIGQIRDRVPALARSAAMSSVSRERGGTRFRTTSERRPRLAPF
jgi:hypothetical protein